MGDAGNRVSNLSCLVTSRFLEGMVVKKVVLKKDSYYDSVFLMLTTRALKQMAGVHEAVLSMGTEFNLELLKEIGFSSTEL